MTVNIGSSPPLQHRGATLAIAMILLLVMTLLGVASVDTLSLQTQLIAHTSTSQALHQLTLNELQAQYERMRDPGFRQQVPLTLSDAPAEDLTLTATDWRSGDSDSKVLRSGTIRFTGDRDITLPGYSQRGFVSRHYEITVTTHSANGAVASSQTLGVAHIVAPNRHHANQAQGSDSQ